MAAAGQFKPEEHRFGPTHWFEDMKVGQKFYINSRTQTEAMFAAFQLASGDNHPVYCGDTLYPMLEVSELKPGRTTGVMTLKLTIHNQKGELVCDGEHKYLVKKRPQ